MIKLTLNPKEVEYLIAILGRCPFTEVHELINKVVDQANASTAAANAAVAAAETSGD
jgi:hypothetical protein